MSLTFFIHLPMKMECIRSSETSAIKIQTPGNYPKMNILQLKHGESLKTRMFVVAIFLFGVPRCIMYLKTSYLTAYRSVCCACSWEQGTVSIKCTQVCCNSHVTFYRNTVTFIQEIKERGRGGEENKNTEKCIRF